MVQRRREQQGLGLVRASAVILTLSAGRCGACAEDTAFVFLHRGKVQFLQTD